MLRLITAAGLSGLWVLAGPLANASAQTAPIVSPADRATLEGSSSTSYPLGRFDCRFQQLFADLGKARMLGGHAYRRDALANRGDILAFQTSMEIHVSRARVTPVLASRIFATNAGATPTRVLGRTLVSFPKTRRPTTIPGSFDFRIPYQTPFAYPGSSTVCVDISIDSNKLWNGNNKTFSPSLDGHELFTSGRNLQPGYRFGKGCTAVGRPSPAYASFELQRTANQIYLHVAARNGVVTNGTVIGRSALLLSLTRINVPWPPGSSCTLYGDPVVALPLTPNNSGTGAWTGTMAMGVPPAVGFEMIGQVLSYSSQSGEVVLADASRLITPPAGQGVVSSRIVNASDRSAASGTVSFAVPVTQFY